MRAWAPPLTAPCSLTVRDGQACPAAMLGAQLRPTKRHWACAEPGIQASITAMLADQHTPGNQRMAASSVMSSQTRLSCLAVLAVNSCWLSEPSVEVPVQASPWVSARCKAVRCCRRPRPFQCPPPTSRCPTIPLPRGLCHSGAPACFHVECRRRTVHARAAGPWQVEDSGGLRKWVRNSPRAQAHQAVWEAEVLFSMAVWTRWQHDAIQKPASTVLMQRDNVSWECRSGLVRPSRRTRRCGRRTACSARPGLKPQWQHPVPPEILTLTAASVYCRCHAQVCGRARLSRRTRRCGRLTACWARRRAAAA